MSKRLTVKAALEHAAKLAEEVGRQTTLGPCDTYHDCGLAGRRIAEAIRSYSLSTRTSQAIQEKP